MVDTGMSFSVIFNRKKYVIIWYIHLSTDASVLVPNSTAEAVK
jgi:hypothetical protein